MLNTKFLDSHHDNNIIKENALKVLEHGTQEYLTKDSSLRKFLNFIEQVLKEKNYN